MPTIRITKRAVDGLRTEAKRTYFYDTELRGFGLMVTPSGTKTFFAEWRAGSGRGAPTKRLTIGPYGTLTVDEARDAARQLLAGALLAKGGIGEDPATSRAKERQTLTVGGLIDLFVAEHLKAKRKASTAEWAEGLLIRLVKPKLGTSKADKVTSVEVARLHRSLKATPYQANRVLAVIASMYSWASKQRLVPRGMNPTADVERYAEEGRERFLNSEELERLGAALRIAETEGIEWQPDTKKPTAKHAPKSAEARRVKLDVSAAAAIRLLIFTGARLREILNLKWAHVDMERGLLLLPESKTGKKTIVLNAPALAVLESLKRSGDYVIAGKSADAPRSDLKRPWAMVSALAELEGLRIHDLRHSFASVGAGSGMGLPIIGRLLGHANARTTARYAHLDADPVRRASNAIASHLAAALDGAAGDNVKPLRRPGAA